MSHCIDQSHLAIDQIPLCVSANEQQNSEHLSAPTSSTSSPATIPKIATDAKRPAASSPCSYEDLVKGDKANLDIFWLKDDGLEDSANLPAPEIIAAEIAEDLQAALDQFAHLPFNPHQNKRHQTNHRDPIIFRNFSFCVCCPGRLVSCLTQFNSFGTLTICLVGS